MWTLSFMVMAIITLNGCSSTQVDQAAAPVPELTFAQLQTIPVNISRIEFDTDAERGAEMWDVANELRTPPDTAMKRYLQKRFRAIGADGILNVNLQKARITAEAAPNENKLLSYVRLADITEYTYDIIVDLETMYLAGQPNTRTSKRFMRKLRMPMNATLSYREAKLQRTLEEIMRDVDESLIRTLAYDFHIIAQRNIPGSALPVKTELPETETDIGVHWREFKKDVGETVDKIEKSFEEGAPENSQPSGQPQVITPPNS
jgi:hypothetical protein